MDLEAATLAVSSPCVIDSLLQLASVCCDGISTTIGLPAVDDLAVDDLAVDDLTDAVFAANDIAGLGVFAHVDPLVRVSHRRARWVGGQTRPPWTGWSDTVAAG